MVNQRGEVKISDFGIARSLSDSMSMLTREPGRSGTLVYMSPQQLAGDRASHLDDIYSLGATLYELLTSKPPFYSGNVDRQIQERVAPAMMERRKEFNIEPAVIPAVWETVVAACLAKDPARRPQSAAGVAQHLQLSSAGQTDWVSEPAGKRSKKRALAVAGITAFLVLALAGLYFGMTKRPRTPAASSSSTGPPAATISEKSIAVLPFENLSKDEENAFFAGGVQDEILTNLAKIADLKVISRMSVMQYKNAARNLREIAHQLGVAHVVEGSVQRAGGRVRVNAQLIDARTDAHLWAEHYDRDLADVFAIQSEIAKAIAEQLHAKISPGEQAAISQAPTSDVVANALYVQAKELEHKPPEDQSLLQGVRLLEEAIGRDPQFLQAYCWLGRFHLNLFFGGYDHTPARRELANAAIQKAARLRPDAGEVHLALARYAYHGFKDYDRARAELDLARRTLPNDAELHSLSAAIDRRQGRWTEAMRNYERAVELDPRNMESLMNAGFVYEALGHYSEATRLYDRAVAVTPSDHFARVMRASVPLSERADLEPLRRELSAILAEEPGAAREISSDLFEYAMITRDAAAAARALDAIPPEGVPSVGNFIRPREWFVGFAARVFKDQATARSAFTAARAIVEKIVRDQPDYAPPWALLGRIDAALGRKEDALREGRRACELLPLSQDTWFGPIQSRDLAVIYAWTGEKDLALEQLALFIQMVPSPLDFGNVKLGPEWDPLRGDPRFEKIVDSLAPKSTK